MAPVADKGGLEGVVVGDTSISSVQQTGLWYRGYSIAELAEHSTFEETAYLILHGELPKKAALDGFSQRVFASRGEAAKVFPHFSHIPRETPLMDVLRTAVSALAHHDPDIEDNSRAANMAKAERLLGQVAELIPAWMRHREGKPPVPAKPHLSHAAQMLYQLRGEDADPQAAEVLDLTLILYAEHEFNASTFAARTTASTLSDMHSAVVAAIGTLKGPLHGGANEKAMEIFTAMKDPASARQWVLDQLAAKARIMGFGHRVYKHGDHRATVLAEKAKAIAASHNDRDWAGIYQAMVDTMKQEKGMFPNLDFPCGLAYLLLGFDRDLCTPLFVASRLSGWCAHIAEQHDNNRLIRPQSNYTGAPHRPYVAVGSR